MDLSIAFTDTEQVELDLIDTATMTALTAIADAQAALRAVRDGLVHPNAGAEQALAAAYEVGDISDALARLRFTLEHAAGMTMLAEQAERRAAREAAAR